MRLRSALAAGVTAAALSPAVVVLPAMADGDPLLDVTNCLSVTVLGTAKPQQCAGGSSQATGVAEVPSSSNTDTGADTATDIGSGEDVGAVGEPDGTGDGTDTSGTDTGTDAGTDTGTDAGTDTTGTGTDTGDLPDLGEPDEVTDSGTTVIPAADPDQTTGDSDTGTNNPVTTSVEQQPAVQPKPKEGLADIAADLSSSCAVADSGDFPIESSINPGPKTYYPGGGFENWSVELTNTSDDTCHNIHPLVVFLDRDRDLQSSQAQLEFKAPDGKWHPVPFERTDVDEHVGVFDDGFGGFSIPAGESVTVPVRLRFTADAQANRITASLAVVQRQGEDGEWVGESDDYVFDISGSSKEGALPSADELAKTGRSGDDSLLGLGATAGAFLLGGGALVVGSRRRFRRR